MDELEHAIINLLVEAWNRFLKLEEIDEWEKVEFMMHIHALQNLIAARHVWKELRDAGEQ